VRRYSSAQRETATSPSPGAFRVLAAGNPSPSSAALTVLAQQRVQEAKDQVQRRDALPQVWEPLPRMHICAQLLQQWIQGLGVTCALFPSSAGGLLTTVDREFRQMNAHIQSLQNQVDDLYASLNALHGRQDGAFGGSTDDPYRRDQGVGPLDPRIAYRGQMTSPDSTSGPRVPPFKGPTASGYNLDLANNSLKTMGITESNCPSDGESQDRIPRQSRSMRIPTPLVTTQSSPLWELSRSEAQRLCGVYEDEVGLLYPMLDMEFYAKKVDIFFQLIESLARTGFMMENRERGETVYDDESMIIRMILSIALTIEGHGDSDLGRRVFENTKEIRGAKLWQPDSVKGLQLLVVVVGVIPSATGNP
jgi:hypothetical protein